MNSAAFNKGNTSTNSVRCRRASITLEARQGAESATAIRSCRAIKRRSRQLSSRSIRLMTPDAEYPTWQAMPARAPAIW